MESFKTSRHPGWELLRPLCAPAEGQAMALSHSHHGPALSPRRLLCHEGGWLFSAGQTVTTTGPSISSCCTAKSGPSGTGCIQVGVRVCLSDSAGPLATLTSVAAAGSRYPQGRGTFQSHGVVLARLPDGPPPASEPFPLWGACFSWWKLQDRQSWQRPIALTS